MPKPVLTLVIKIGTAALTGSDGAPDSRLLGALVDEIVALKKSGHQVVLVSSGAVGTGRSLVKKNPLYHCDTVTERQILASLGQAKLMALYQELLSPHKLLASQILLTKQDFNTRKHQKTIAHLFQALRQQPNILPIINENDCVTVDELMFTDNDELAGLLAAMMNADRLIILSHIAGVYDRPPDEEGSAVIPLIDFEKRTGIPDATRGKSTSGRGGMASKLGMAKKMASLGIQTHVAAARDAKIITRILRDESVGTTVRSMKGKRNAVKRWLASEVNSVRGSITANACLVEMMRKPHAAFSILPVGLTSISGPFEKGDLVQLVDEKGEALALGVAKCDASALRPMLGKKNQPVFIHYDQLHRLDHDPSA